MNKCSLTQSHTHTPHIDKLNWKQMIKWTKMCRPTSTHARVNNPKIKTDPNSIHVENDENEQKKKWIQTFMFKLECILSLFLFFCLTKRIRRKNEAKNNNNKTVVFLLLINAITRSNYNSFFSSAVISFN